MRGIALAIIFLALVLSELSLQMTRELKRSTDLIELAIFIMAVLCVLAGI
jgi:hypothetical protein